MYTMYRIWRRRSTQGTIVLEGYEEEGVVFLEMLELA